MFSLRAVRKNREEAAARRMYNESGEMVWGDGQVGGGERFYPAREPRPVGDELSEMGLYWPGDADEKNAAKRAARGWKPRREELAGPPLPGRTFPHLQGER